MADPLSLKISMGNFIIKTEPDLFHTPIKKEEENDSKFECSNTFITQSEIINEDITGSLEYRHDALVISKNETIVKKEEDRFIHNMKKDLTGEEYRYLLQKKIRYEINKTQHKLGISAENISHISSRELCTYPGGSNSSRNEQLLVSGRRKFITSLGVEKKSFRGSNRTLKNEHSDGHNSNCKDAKFQCAQCLMYCFSLKSYEDHIFKVHRRQYQCIGCKEVFYYKKLFQAHISAVHLNIYKCTKCFKKFDSEKSVQRHMSKSHKKYVYKN